MTGWGFFVFVCFLLCFISKHLLLGAEFSLLDDSLFTKAISFASTDLLLLHCDSIYNCSGRISPC